MCGALPKATHAQAQANNLSIPLRGVQTRQRLEQVTSILFVVLFLVYSGYNLYNDYLALPSNFYDLLRVDSYASQ